MALRVALILGLAGACLPGCQDPADKANSSDAVKAMEGLRELAKRGGDADVARIAEAVGHQDTMVASEAVRSLGSMRQAKAAEALKRVASTERRPEVREEAVLQLGRQTEGDPLVLLRRVVRSDPDPRVRAAAATSLGHMKSLADVPLLVEVAETDADPMVQARAVGAIERMIGLKFGYEAKDPPEERAKAVARVRSIAPTAAATLQQRRAQQNRAGR
jgi:HEAT repeat protein